MLFSKGQDLIERCVLRRGGVETYTLPYFAGELTELKAETLYRAIHSLDSESEYTDSSHAPMARVTYEIQENDDPAVRALKDEIRFYVVSLPISDDKTSSPKNPRRVSIGSPNSQSRLSTRSKGRHSRPNREDSEPTITGTSLIFPTRRVRLETSRSAKSSATHSPTPCLPTVTRRGRLPTNRRPPTHRRSTT